MILQIYWHVECGETFDNTTSHGIITSPGYPDAYKNNLRCRYHIDSPPNDFVILSFQEPFELEGGKKTFENRVSLIKNIWALFQLATAITTWSM